MRVLFLLVLILFKLREEGGAGK